MSPRGRARDRTTGQTTNQARDQTTDRTTDRTTNQATDRTAGRTTDQLTEQTTGPSRTKGRGRVSRTATTAVAFGGFRAARRALVHVGRQCCRLRTSSFGTRGRKENQAMWQRLLDRFVPLMEAAPSRLDRLDGVGGPSAEHAVPSSTAMPPDAASSGFAHAPHAG